MYIKLKRLIDFLLASVALVILSPLFLALIIAIKADSPGPVLFRQKRVGIHKSHFSILKFRTMRADTPRDIPTHLMKEPDQYITKVGRFLRRTSLDELPQIFNIISGKMAIIGPRPALWNQYDLIEERDKYGVNNVRPGLSGLAQISGRDELLIPDKAKVDGDYARHISAKMDLKCFFKTVKKVLKHEGVVEGGTGALNEANEPAAK
jgi:O-antigen biosynthesis protein WbqP